MRFVTAARTAVAVTGAISLALGIQLFPHVPASRAATGQRGTAAASPSPSTSAPSSATDTPKPGKSSPSPSHSPSRLPVAPRGGATVRGPHMLNPNTINQITGKAKRFPFASSVTVSQTRNLVNQTIRVSWRGFTPTNNSSSSAPGYSNTNTIYPVMVAQCRGFHPRNIFQCFGSTSGGITGNVLPAGPNNIAFGTTTKGGSGFVQVQILTSIQNQFLGCGPGHPCSLVVVPNQGGQNLAPPFDCKNHLADIATPGPATGAGMVPSGGAPVCSWSSRIVIPLNFAPIPKSCPISNGALSIIGSPMMQRAMSQWDTQLCGQAQPLPVLFNSAVPEPTAVTDVQSGQVDVALTTRPAVAAAGGAPLTGGKHQFAYAPVAVSAVSAAFWNDDPVTGNPYQHMRLDPRLVLKLLTNSYNLAGVACGRQLSKGCDRGVNFNPSSIFADPEFRILNRHMAEPIQASSLQANPLVPSGHSDMTYEITRWIAANKDAKAFLGGQFDPWGTHVNSYYLGLKYPTDAFLAQDPSPFTSHAYSPLFPLSQVTTAMLTNATGDTNPFPSCIVQNGVKTCNFDKYPAELPGQRSLFSLLDNASAAAFQFPVASLLNPAGRYVAPTRASMAAALTTMVTDKKTGTEQFSTKSKNRNAYPLTMVIYAMVPTSGVSAAKAALITHWLQFVAGPGQVPGNNPGQLPPGYLPLTSALRAQTLKVAGQVSAQHGNGSGGKKTTSPSPSTSPSTSPSLPASASSPPALPTVTPKISTVALRSPLGTGIIRYAFPILLIAGGLAALGGASSMLSAEPWPVLVGRLRRIRAHARRRGRGLLRLRRR